jgi:sulfur-oxidizing protein SoxB
VRVVGLTYSCEPNAPMSARIGDLRVKGVPIEAGKRYRVAGWASVSDDPSALTGEPVWEVVARHLRARRTIAAREPDRPRLIGVAGNAGIV